eukprot:TRINITY_DN67819_c0_g1_i1.p1 TRINITY_DN67819_c0_g1~~TRINITY_DN67819_c0_g1_i1.p1  ORF type:complete len:801 (+),score=78.09 TRINITY_DN67819_c0_g1_i1:22-2424(+)
MRGRTSQNQGLSAETPDIVRKASRTPSEASPNRGVEKVPHPDSFPRKPSVTPDTSRRTSKNDCIKVYVRLRPFLPREIESHARVKPCVDMNANSVWFSDGSQSAQSYVFDHCFWSIPCALEAGRSFASQEVVYAHCGKPLLEAAWEGFNTTLLSYGMTGSGKSYTMLGGPGEQAGIMPRMCHDLFQKISQQSAGATWKVQISFMELYNEQVRDLLAGKESYQKLRVRQHPITGPFVEGLVQHQVTSREQCLELLWWGNKHRAVAPTKLNDASSRSHAIFQIILQKMHTTEEDPEVSIHSASTMNLVDLAGSERNHKSGATGHRLVEASSVNLSLHTLRKVIDALIENRGRLGTYRLPPYRDSMLTWILSESLGGNSRTVMVATISPSASCASETAATLKYALRAKSVANHAVINETKSSRLVRELRAEVQSLQNQLSNLMGRSLSVSSSCGSFVAGSEGSEPVSSPRNLSDTMDVDSRVAELEERIHLGQQAISELEEQQRVLEHLGNGTRNRIERQLRDNQELEKQVTELRQGVVSPRAGSPMRSPKKASPSPRSFLAAPLPDPEATEPVGTEAAANTLTQLLREADADRQALEGFSQRLAAKYEALDKMYDTLRVTVECLRTKPEFATPPPRASPTVSQPSIDVLCETNKSLYEENRQLRQQLKDAERLLTPTPVESPVVTTLLPQKQDQYLSSIPLGAVRSTTPTMYGAYHGRSPSIAALSSPRTSIVATGSPGLGRAPAARRPSTDLFGSYSAPFYSVSPARSSTPLGTWSSSPTVLVHTPPTTTTYVVWPVGMTT